MKLETTLERSQRSLAVDVFARKAQVGQTTDKISRWI